MFFLIRINNYHNKLFNLFIFYYFVAIKQKPLGQKKTLLILVVFFQLLKTTYGSLKLYTNPGSTITFFIYLCQKNPEFCRAEDVETMHCHDARYGFFKFI